MNWLAKIKTNFGFENMYLIILYLFKKLTKLSKEHGISVFKIMNIIIVPIFSELMNLSGELYVTAYCQAINHISSYLSNILSFLNDENSSNNSSLN